MAREKGASATDRAAHRFYDDVILRRERRAVCRRCGNKLGTAYHEERLYSVGCDKCETVTLVKARDPYEAAEKVGIIPRTAEGTDLSPQEVEELKAENREMRGRLERILAAAMP